MWIPLNVEPYDCEMCGRSYDELTVEFDASPGEAGLWHGSLRVGCTGGANITGSRSRIIDWLLQECAEYVDEDVLNRAIDTLRSA